MAVSSSRPVSSVSPNVIRMGVPSAPPASCPPEAGEKCDGRVPAPKASRRECGGPIAVPVCTATRGERHGGEKRENDRTATVCGARPPEVRGRRCPHRYRAWISGRCSRRRRAGRRRRTRLAPGLHSHRTAAAISSPRPSRPIGWPAHGVLDRELAAGDHVGDHRRLDRAGADRVDADAARRVLERGALGQAEHAVLGGVVGRRGPGCRPGRRATSS